MLNNKSIMVIVIIAVSPVNYATAQTLTNNRSWTFQSPDDLSVRQNRLDLEERKKGGYFDSFQTVNKYKDNIFNSYNCTGSNASNRANEAVTTVEATTGSPSTGSQIESGAGSTANENSSLGLKSGPLNGSQDTSGDISSSMALNLANDTKTITTDGASNSQSSQNEQLNSGSLTATSSAGLGCNFDPTASSLQVGWQQ